MTNELAIELMREIKTNNYWVPAVHEALDLAISALERDEWISSEEPPDNPRDVLVTAFWHERWQTLFGWYDVKWHVATYDKWHEDLSVIAWKEKPLPALPKEET